MTLQQTITTANAQAVKAADAVLKAAVGYHTTSAKPKVELAALTAIEEMYTYYGGDRA